VRSERSFNAFHTHQKVASSHIPSKQSHFLRLKVNQSMKNFFQNVKKSHWKVRGWVCSSVLFLQRKFWVRKRWLNSNHLLKL